MIALHLEDGADRARLFKLDLPPPTPGAAPPFPCRCWFDRKPISLHGPVRFESFSGTGSGNLGSLYGPRPRGYAKRRNAGQGNYRTQALPTV
jgi:hypothetical protein